MNTAPATAADLTTGTVIRETSSGNLYVLTCDAKVEGDGVDFKGTRVTKGGRLMKPRPNEVYYRLMKQIEVVTGLTIQN